jgi:hypothetical protein
LENWHSDSLKRFKLLFLRVRRKRDEIADDEDDDDVVGTSVHKTE